jgi:hypothetical protein
VVTSTGPSTISLGVTGTLGSDELEQQELSAGSGATWSADTKGSTLTPTTGTVTFRSLSPSGTGEVYFGYAGVNGSASPGTTPGFDYTATDSANLLTVGHHYQPNGNPCRRGVGLDSVAALFAATTSAAPTTTAATRACRGERVTAPSGTR